MQNTGPGSTTRLRIGRIAYANLFPIFYMLRKAGAERDYDIVEGVPAELNRMLREGSIDISPSSSIEYLRNPSRYRFIRGHSISADGPVQSIFLFSRRPIEELGGSTILTSSQSETSVALVEVICRKFYGLGCRFRSSSEPQTDAAGTDDAFMLIGDDAIAQSQMKGGMLVHDLGSLWKKHTGLPFTYALWLVRNEAAEQFPGELAAFTRQLDLAKEAAGRGLAEAAQAWPRGDILPPDRLVRYWQGITYGLTAEHWKSLDLFRQYAVELGLLS